MRRTLILTTIGAVALTLGLGVGATLAGSSPISRATNMMTTNGGHMGDTGDMTSMMNGVDMTSMMSTGGMDAMHTAMHDALAGTVPADILAACDTAHDAMTTTTGTASTGMPGHAAHHPGSQP